MGRVKRVAVVGGDGRLGRRWDASARVRSYPSRRRGGRNAVRRFEASLKAGGVDHVVVLARFLGHDAFARVRALCRAYRVPMEVWARGG